MRFRMDWRAIRFDWNKARAFLVTAEEGSLSAAARALGMAQPTLGRQVSALEAELGVALFERIGRGLTLTKSGLELVEHVRAMGEAANAMSLAASGRAQSIEGAVRISASEVGAAFSLSPVLLALRRTHPRLRIEIVATNSVSDLRRREADIAVRAARPTDPELIARKLRGSEARLFAARSYLAEFGPFDTPERLSRAHHIGFEENASYIAALNRFGLNVTPDDFPIVTASHLTQWELVKKGVGIGVMVSEAGDSEPAVARAAPWLEPFRFDLWLVAHRELNTSRRVRLVFDALAAALG